MYNNFNKYKKYFLKLIYSKPIKKQFKLNFFKNQIKKKNNKKKIKKNLKQKKKNNLNFPHLQFY